MRNKLIILTAALLLSSSGCLFAEEGKKEMMMDQNEMMAKEGTMMDQEVVPTETKAIEVGNKICPVSGEDIPAPGEKGEMGEAVKYEYKGKIYNLCCPMCIKDFKKDPEKYSKIADDEVAKEKMTQEENKTEQKNEAAPDQK